MIQAASGRNSAISSGIGVRQHAEQQQAGRDAQEGRDAAERVPEQVGLGAQRERRRADDEARSRCARRVRAPSARAPVRPSTCSGSELPAMKPATQAIACSASTSRLRASTRDDVAEVADGERRAQRDDLLRSRRPATRSARPPRAARRRRAPSRRPSARARGRGAAATRAASRACGARRARTRRPRHPSPVHRPPARELKRRRRAGARAT